MEIEDGMIFHAEERGQGLGKNNVLIFPNAKVLTIEFRNRAPHPPPKYPNSHEVEALGDDIYKHLLTVSTQGCQ